MPVLRSIRERLAAARPPGGLRIGAGLPGGRGIKLRLSDPLLLDDVAADFPGLTIILAHPSVPWADAQISMYGPMDGVFISGGARVRGVPGPDCPIPGRGGGWLRLNKAGWAWGRAAVLLHQGLEIDRLEVGKLQVLRRPLPSGEAVAESDKPILPQLDAIKLKVPILVNILGKTAIARCTRTLGTLISAGVPILDAINITKETCGNEVYSRALSKAHDAIRERLAAGRLGIAPRTLRNKIKQDPLPPAACREYRESAPALGKRLLGIRVSREDGARLAESPMLFPSDKDASRLHVFPNLPADVDARVADRGRAAAAAGSDASAAGGEPCCMLGCHGPAAKGLVTTSLPSTRRPAMP